MSAEFRFSTPPEVASERSSLEIAKKHVKAHLAGVSFVHPKDPSMPPVSLEQRYGRNYPAYEALTVAAVMVLSMPDITEQGKEEQKRAMDEWEGVATEMGLPEMMVDDIRARAAAIRLAMTVDANNRNIVDHVSLRTPLIDKLGLVDNTR